MLKSLIDQILDLLFPKFCLGCQTEGSFLCQDCKSLLEILEFNYCLCNSKPTTLPFGSKSGKCPKCSDKKLSGLFFALPYKDLKSKKSLVKKLIYQFKYKPYLKGLSKPLAEILIEHFIKTGKNTDEIWENSILIPIPLSKEKRKARGYSQTEELAKELAKILKIPLISDLLAKTKNTAPQMELKKEEREKNLIGAFSINKNSAKANLTEFKKIFLVDDVYTTGSTMEECAKVLRKAGAKSVWGICIAREAWKN